MSDSVKIQQLVNKDPSIDIAKLSPSQANPRWAEVSQPARKSFFPDLLESWNFVCNLNLTQLALKWEKMTS